MGKRLVTFLLLILLTGCLSTNEDPTNIELEVLRAGLLEKELSIDKLRQSLDENTRIQKTLEAEIERLTIEVDRERSIKEKLLEGQTQILVVQDAKEHFYDLIKESLYILTVHEDEEIDYLYEQLYKYSNKNETELVYKGEDIQFRVNEMVEVITIIDKDKLKIIDKTLKLRYEDTIDLNDPLIELTPSLYLDNHTGMASYVLMWKYIDEDVPTLYSILAYDYTDLNQIKFNKYNIDTQSYFIDDERSFLVYVEVREDGNYLMKLNLVTGEESFIAQNATEPFSLYKSSNNIYYYNQYIDGFIGYNND